MKAFFMDTLYLVARLNPRDQWHEKARVLSHELASARFVTTESVLLEVLNFFAAYRPEMRQAVTAFVREALGDASVEVVPHSRDAFLKGLDLYESRLDKGYSLTDCISMTVMRERNVYDVLTHDRHFSQEGFDILLR
jgi:predicted nucleic acid-binding protein